MCVSYFSPGWIFNSWISFLFVCIHFFSRCLWNTAILAFLFIDLIDYLFTFYLLQKCLWKLFLLEVAFQLLTFICWKNVWETFFRISICWLNLFICWRSVCESYFSPRWLFNCLFVEKMFVKPSSEFLFVDLICLFVDFLLVEEVFVKVISPQGGFGQRLIAFLLQSIHVTNI